MKNISPIVYLKLVFVLIAVIVFFYFYDGIDLYSFLYELKDLNLLYFSLAIFCFILKYLMLSQKFYILSSLNQRNGPIGFFKTEFIIQFIDLIIPIPDIEDILRTVFLKSEGVSLNKSIALVFINRMIGLISFSMFIVFSSLFSFNYYYGFLYNKLNKASTLPLILAFTMFVLILVALSVFYFKFKVNKYAIVNVFGEIKSNLNWLRAIVAFVFSNAHYLFWILAIFFMVKSVGMEVSLFSIMLIIPLLILSFLMPFSYQGLGLPETALFLYLNFLGLPPKVSFSIAFLHFICYLIAIAIGGFLFLIGNTFKLNNLRI